MAAYLDLNEFVNRCSGGNSGLPEIMFMHKEARVAGAAAQTPVAGKWTSYWLYEGQPSHGATPTTVAAPTRATQGAWGQANPGGGRQKWMSALVAACGSQGTLMLYDRLLHIGGLDGTVTTAQTVGGALTRFTGGSGNIMWAEIYTAIGGTTSGITASYTNQSGAFKTSTAVQIGNTNFKEAQRILPLSLAAGDSGVQGVTSVTLSLSTGTAGNFGITVAHPLAYIGCAQSGLAGVRSFLEGGMVEIPTDACLAWAFLPVSTTGNPLDAFMFSTER